MVTLKDAADIKAKIGTLSKINPVTGEEAGEFEWFYTVPLHYFTDYTIDYEKIGTINEKFTAVSIHGNEFSRTEPVRDGKTAAEADRYECNSGLENSA